MKEKHLTKIAKKLFSALMALTLVVSVMSVGSVTTYASVAADQTHYAVLNNTSYDLDASKYGTIDSSREVEGVTGALTTLKSGVLTVGDCIEFQANNSYWYIKEVVIKGTIEGASTISGEDWVYDSSAGTLTFSNDNATKGYSAKLKATGLKITATEIKFVRADKDGIIHTHTFGEWVEEVPATATEEGTKGHYTCTGCKKNFASDKTIELTDLTIPKTTSSGTTEVSLTVETTTKNTYTMTVPAKTELASNGDVTSLTNGIVVSGGTLENGKKLTVTATSKNSWSLTAEGVTGGIGYALYSDSAAETAATSWEFTQAEANATAGTTKNVYAKPVAENLKSAAEGTYSDVITFVASVESAE